MNKHEEQTAKAIGKWMSKHPTTFDMCLEKSEVEHVVCNGYMALSMLAEEAKTVCEVAQINVSPTDPFGILNHFSFPWDAEKVDLTPFTYESNGRTFNILRSENGKLKTVDGEMLRLTQRYLRHAEKLTFCDTSYCMLAVVATANGDSRVRALLMETRCSGLTDDLELLRRGLR